MPVKTLRATKDVDQENEGSPENKLAEAPPVENLPDLAVPGADSTVGQIVSEGAGQPMTEEEIAEAKRRESAPDANTLPDGVPNAPTGKIRQGDRLAILATVETVSNFDGKLKILAKLERPALDGSQPFIHIEPHQAEFEPKA